MVPITKLKNTFENSTTQVVFKPFLLLFNIIGCTTLNIHLQFSWLSSAHAVLVILSIVAASCYVLSDQDDYSLLEESLDTARLVGRMKLGCTATIAVACTTITLIKTKPLMDLITRIEQFSRSFPLNTRPFRWMALRCVGLSVLLVSAGIQDIIMEPKTLALPQFFYFVEYYCHLVVLFTEYQFAVLVRLVGVLLTSVTEKMKQGDWKTRYAMQQSVRYERKLKKCSEDLQLLFGVQMLVALFSSFVLGLISSYFSLLYVVNWLTNSLDALPTMAIMYAALVLFISLKLQEIISATHHLRMKAEVFAMEIDNVILTDVTKTLQSDPVLQTYLQGRQEWKMYAGHILILDFGLITDMAAANTTYLVLLLQFGLRPC